MLRYSGGPIFGIMETKHLYYMWNIKSATKVLPFHQNVPLFHPYVGQLFLEQPIEQARATKFLAYP